jgi:hypothetical protein
MPGQADRALLARLVEAYDRIAEHSFGLGDRELYEMEEKLYNAIIDTPYRAVIKHGEVYLADPNGLPGEVILVDPATQENLDDPDILNLDES